MEFKIPSELKNIPQISQKILQSLPESQADDMFLYDVRLACEEAMVNAIRHGNNFEIDKSVTINCKITPEAVVITVEDEGPGFEYRDLPDPTKEENLPRLNGRGIFLIRAVMDKVEFNPSGNRITMTKFFPKNQARPGKD